MNAKCTVEYICDTYTQVLDYTERVKIEYNKFGVSYKIDIYYREIFDNYRVIIII